MKQQKTMFAFAIGMAMFAGCSKNADFSKQAGADEQQALANKAANATTARNRDCDETDPGRVYTLNNQTDNKVVIYSRAQNGSLNWQSSVSTGGSGTGAGLGSQGALVLTDDGSMLLAVNAASNSISCFKITSNGLVKKSMVSSGGTMPISITQSSDYVYALNAGGTGNISGFRLSNSGMLTPLANSTMPLSSSASGPAQVSFVKNGKVLVVTEKATNKIITYVVNQWGMPGAMHSLTSATPTPFGFAEAKKGTILVSEASGGAPGASALSSYDISNNGTITLMSGPVATSQTAACWVAINKKNTAAYTTNTGSNNISSFNVTPMGNISLNTAMAAPANTVPIDAAFSKNSKFLYVLTAGTNSISGYGADTNGDLTVIGQFSGLPMGTVGLVAN